MKITKTFIGILLVFLLAYSILAQPQLGNPQQGQEKQGVEKATELLNQYSQYFGYYQAIVSGQVGSIIYRQFLSLAMKDADPQTKTTITFLQTLKGVMPKKTQGRVPSQQNKAAAQQKQSEISEA